MQGKNYMNESIEHSSNQQEFIIDGASCGSCVSKIENAVQQVSGVTHAEMNFAQRTMSVEGTSNSSAIISAVEKAGYQAKVSEAKSEDDALTEKEASDLVYSKRLMKQTWIALSLGVPLMAYALIAGEMNVNTLVERIAWFIVGLLTFGVLIASGKHFYLSLIHI